MTTTPADPSSPDFVLLEHRMPHGMERAGVHWDLMFRQGDRLLTLAIDQCLTTAAAPNAITVPALWLPDHRLAYLEYEGEISGDRGSVERILRGVFDGGWEPSDDQQQCFVANLTSPSWRGDIRFTPASRESGSLWIRRDG